MRTQEKAVIELENRYRKAVALCASGLCTADIYRNREQQLTSFPRRSETNGHDLLFLYNRSFSQSLFDYTLSAEGFNVSSKVTRM